jgi:hypothetical protein
MTFWSGAIDTPETSTARVVVRKNVCTGEM